MDAPCNRALGYNIAFGATYRNAPETLARVAEFLALASSLQEVPPEEIAATQQNIIAHRQEIARLSAELAILEDRARRMQDAVRDEAVHYRRANELAYHLAAELPIHLWRAIARGGSGKVISDVWGALDVIRSEMGTPGEFLPDDQFLAKPGIKREMDAKPTR
jgi:hypothetical protein